jgi:hypothetical protein
MEEEPTDESAGPAVLVSALKWAAGLSDSNRLLVGCGIILLAALSLLPFLNEMPNGDVLHYNEVANDLLVGKLPYRDRVFEYPPYAVPIFLLPRLFGDDDYTMRFMAFGMLADWFLRFQLLKLGMKSEKRKRWLLPLLLYSAGIPFIQRFYLQRFDIWPALLCVLVVSWFCSRRYALAGLVVAVGACTKVYPLLFVPALLAIARRQNCAGRLATGMCVGFAPVLFMGVYLPWWRFAEFQGARGLQVESLYASILWFGSRLGVVHLQWIWNRAWFEISGPSASFLLPWARGLFVAAVGGSVAVGTWFASQCENLTAGRLARLLLLPLLAFVGFNTVLSPQFMIWLAPLAAVASLDGNKLSVALIGVATMLTPVFYPCRDYNIGLSLFETSALLLRNLMLVAVWGLLLREMWFSSRGLAPEANRSQRMASLLNISK